MGIDAISSNNVSNNKEISTAVKQQDGVTDKAKLETSSQIDKLKEEILSPQEE
jgi:hypothetical protein